MKARSLVVLAALAALAVAAAGHKYVPDYSQVTEWEATPVVTASDAHRFAEIPEGQVCGSGRCPFETGVCCKDTNTCCEWGRCAEDGKGTCRASSEQNALQLAKAFVTQEAKMEVAHEQDTKSKSEQGVKLQQEAAKKNTEEASEKKQATVEEALAKKEETAKHEAKLAKAESDEQANKDTEAKTKRGEQSAMMDKFNSERQIVFAEGRTFPLANDKCFGNQLKAPAAFTYMFWLFLNSPVTAVRNVLETNQLQLQLTNRDGGAVLHVIVFGKAGPRPFTSSLKVPVGSWVHIAVAVDVDSVDLMLGGEAVQTQPLPEGFGVDATTRPGVACATKTDAAPAQMADLRLVQSSLAPAAVAAVVKEARYTKVSIKNTLKMIRADAFRPSRGLQVATDEEIAVESGYSMGFHIRVQGQVSSETNVLHKGLLNGGSGPSVFLAVQNNKPILRIVSSGTVAKFEVPALFTWFHVAWTHDSSKLTVFVDGKQIGQESSAAPKDSDGPLYAGWQHGPVAPVFLANLAYAPTVWAAADVRTLMAETYNTQFFPENTPLIKSQDLATAKVYPATGGTAGVDKLIPPSPCRTYAFWINPNDAPGTPNWSQYRQIIHKGSADSERGPAIWFMPSSTKLHIRSGTLDEPNYGLDYNKDVPAKVWTHVAVVHCYRMMQVYINSNKEGEDSNAKEPRSNQAPLYVPGPFGHKSATGTIADLRYYDYALSQKQIHALFEQALYK